MRVRIPYAPPQSSAWSENHLVERFIRSGEDGNARILRTSLRTSKSAHGPSRIGPPPRVQRLDPYPGFGLGVRNRLRRCANATAACGQP